MKEFGKKGKLKLCLEYLYIIGFDFFTFFLLLSYKDALTGDLLVCVEKKKRSRASNY